jgi:hypothetical protein
MAYFIFLKNSDNVDNTLYRIAEDENALNNLNINKNDYKIIQDTIENFNSVKFENKIALKYNNSTITYIDLTTTYSDRNALQTYINDCKQSIKDFLNNNPNHPLFNQWNNYYNQINNLNLNTIVFPLNKSLEQYFNDLGQPVLNILQLP